MASAKGQTESSIFVMDTTLNYSQLCRLCMGAEVHMVQIFGDGNAMRTHSIASQILSITSLEVGSDDGLPPRICQHCFEQLQLSFRFRQMSRLTDATLRSKMADTPFEELHVKQEPSEPRCCQPEECPLPPAKTESPTTTTPLPGDPDTPADDGQEINEITPDLQSEPTPPLEGGAGAGAIENEGPKRRRKHLFERPRKLRATDSPRRYQCSRCSKCYVKRSTLTQHMRCHGERCVHVCPVCDRAFLHASLLSEHSRSHSGERPYRCSVCSKAFSHKNDFLKHMRTHTRERPFACPVCDKRFSQNGHLGVHLRCHTGEKPYACLTCGKTFAYQNSLSLHVSSHLTDKPFVCAFCAKAFAGKKNLAKHVRYHTDSRPFVCPFCSKAFFYPGDLAAHTRRHTGEKPFACTQCGRAFAQKKQFTAHAKSHAQET